MIPSIARLRELLTQTLPGEAAHSEMYPRAGIRAELLQPDAHTRLSAVAILISAKQDDLQALVIQRSVYDGAHSGQIAFPGGKWEPDDVNGYQTALRECSEEIGVEAHELVYLGKLTDVYTAVSSFLIEPHIFYWNAPRTGLQLAEREVAAVHTISLSRLLDDTSIIRKDIAVQNGVILKQVPHFDFGTIQIWGATALMLSELKSLLRSL